MKEKDYSLDDRNLDDLTADVEHSTLNAIKDKVFKEYLLSQNVPEVAIDRALPSKTRPANISPAEWIERILDERAESPLGLPPIR